MTEIMKSCSSSSSLEQFLLLAKSAEGLAAVSLIRQAVETPGVYVFGELIDMPSVGGLRGTEYEPFYDLLNLFAYGTFKDYCLRKDSFPELSPAMIKKLRHLTICTLATRNQLIPYSLLQAELQVESERELEDLIIDVIYSDVVRGKMDQQKKLLEVHTTLGRDVPASAVRDMIMTLGEWSSTCEGVLVRLQTEVELSTQRCKDAVQTEEKVRAEVASVRKAVQSQHAAHAAQVSSDSMECSSDPAAGPPKKAGKMKGKAAGSKFWK